MRLRPQVRSSSSKHHSWLQYASTASSNHPACTVLLGAQSDETVGHQNGIPLMVMSNQSTPAVMWSTEIGIWEEYCLYLVSSLLRACLPLVMRCSSLLPLLLSAGCREGWRPSATPLHLHLFVCSGLLLFACCDLLLVGCSSLPVHCCLSVTDHHLLLNDQESFLGA